MGVSQHYLFEARQMQALSLAVHIPLVCFGIAFPVLVLFADLRARGLLDGLPGPGRPPRSAPRPPR